MQGLRQPTPLQVGSTQPPSEVGDACAVLLLLQCFLQIQCTVPLAAAVSDVCC